MYLKVCLELHKKNWDTSEKYNASILYKRQMNMELNQNLQVWVQSASCSSFKEFQFGGHNK
jgi:hypothetical protein